MNNEEIDEDTIIINEERFRESIDNTKRINMPCLFGRQEKAVYWNVHEFPKYCKKCGSNNLTLQIHPLEARNYFYCRNCEEVIDETLMMNLREGIEEKYIKYNPNKE
jgi:hypothetical protein